MAEFREIMRQWKRMCAKMQTMDGCDVCPITTMTNDKAKCPKANTMANISGLTDIEQIVLRWAEKNPESKYPSWAEWLESIGLIGRSELCNMRVFRFTEADKPIPDDIAEKLEIEPKNGNHEYEPLGSHKISLMMEKDNPEITSLTWYDVIQIMLLGDIQEHKVKTPITVKQYMKMPVSGEMLEKLGIESKVGQRGK